MGTVLRACVTIVISVATVSNSALVHAQSETATITKLLITELQTESLDSANEEFIEISNVSGEDVDIEGWVVQYRAASGSSWQDKALLNGKIYKTGSIVISTQNYNVDSSTFYWTASGGQLASSGGNIRLLNPLLAVAEDTLAWGSGIFGESEPADKPATGKSLHRKSIDGVFMDTNINAQDFIADTPDPINNNTLPEPDPISDPPSVDDPVDPSPVDDPAQDPETPPGPDADQPTEPLPTENPDPQPDPVLPTPDVLLPVVINELMINPKSPELDSTDEWIELYNPNDSAFDLSGYKLQTGTSFSYNYVFGSLLIQPFDYYVITSGESSLALSNTSGAVRLLGKDGLVNGQAVGYEDVEEGSSYALDDNLQWRWTTTSTSGKKNIFTEAPTIIKSPVASVKKSTSTKASTPKATTSKVTAVKASATKSATKSASKSAPAPDSTFNDAPPTPATRPLLLATFAVVAVIYGVYEYRDDITNSLWRTRRYLEFRRKNRQGL